MTTDLVLPMTSGPSHPVVGSASSMVEAAVPSASPAEAPRELGGEDSTPERVQIAEQKP
jgi:hypothetical protein